MEIMIVTGAAGNLGRAISTRLLAAGAQVIALDRPGPVLDALANLPGADHLQTLPVADLTDEAATTAAIASVIARHGRIDGVAHTVGGFAMGGIAASGPALWEEMFRLNVLTTLNVLRAAAVPMQAAGRGSLVAVGAGAALRAPAGMAAYAASKSAVLRLVESLADELKATGIRVNSVLPGTMDTPQNRAAMPDADPALWTRPDEVARTIAFLLSADASGITGAHLPVPGRG